MFLPLSSLGAANPPDEIIIKFHERASNSQIEHGIRHGGLHLKRYLRTAAMDRNRQLGLTIANSDLRTDEALRRLNLDPSVEYAERNVRYRVQSQSNDPYYLGGYQWGLYGATGGSGLPTNRYGISATEAWANGHTGSQSVLVALIDEGIQITHPDLAPNIWTNPYDPPNGIDDDGNGYIDDAHGWDFASDTNAVFTPGSDAHGTHVAGTIGAKGGNAQGGVGVNWNVSLIPAKFIKNGLGSSIDAVEAVDYIIDLKSRHNLNIVAINASWGANDYSRALHEAVIRAAKAGILFICAAGNSAANNDLTGSYPANLSTLQATAGESAAAYNSVISVAALDKTGGLAPFSNYGANKVHLAAPGVEILSTYPDGWAYSSGTSMAAPHVTGAVALYASAHPSATAEEIRSAILGFALPTSSLAGKTATGGRLHLGDLTVPKPPEPPTGLIPEVQNGAIQLTWNSAPDAQSYTVKRALLDGGSFTVLASGLTTNRILDTAVAHNQTFYYAVFARNNAGASADSSIVSAVAVTRVPAAPATLRALADTNQIGLSWEAGSDAASFQVQRSASPGGPFVPVAVGLTTRSFIDTAVASGTLYYYSVSAFNVAGFSPASSAIAVRVLPTPPSGDSAVDTDGDGFTTLEEFYLGMNPSDAGDSLRVTSTAGGGNSFTFDFNSSAGKQYLVEFNDAFPSGDWQVAATLQATGPLTEFTDPAAGGDQRIYRLRDADFWPAHASECAGFRRFQFQGNSDTLFSVPFFRPAEALGNVAASDNATVQITGSAPWAPNQWVYSSGSQSNTYFLFVRTGSLAGEYRTILGNTADSVTLDSALPGLLPGDSVAITPYWTLGTIFPSGRGVHSSATAGTRLTEVFFPNRDGDGVNLGPAAIFYFRNGAWRKVGEGNAVKNDQVLLPDSFLVVRHNVAEPTELLAHGAVLHGDWRIHLRRKNTGNQDNLVSIPRPCSVSLNGSGLIESGTFQPSLTAGTRTDELYVYDNQAAVINRSPSAIYYYRYGAWRKVGAGLADVGEDLVFTPGSGFVIRAAPASLPDSWDNKPQY